MSGDETIMLIQTKLDAPTISSDLVSMPRLNKHHITAIDGKIGKVDGFMVNPENSHVTHLILEKGHIWGHHDVAIPIASVTLMTAWWSPSS